MSMFQNWWNNLTGQGTTGDHSAQGIVEFRRPKTSMEITELLQHAPIMRAAVEAMPEDITRAWREHTSQAAKMLAVEEEFDLREVAERTMFYAEGYGGSIVMPRYADNIVDEEGLKKPRPKLTQGLLGFKVYAPHQLRATPGTEKDRQTNGLPMFYSPVGNMNIKIHSSWTYAYRGAIALPQANEFLTGSLEGILGQSRVDLIFDDFDRMTSGLTAISHILTKSNIDILKISGLAEALAQCTSTAEIHQALNKLVTQATSTITGANTYQPMVVDKDEEVERKGIPMTGTSQIVEVLIQMFVAASRIPATRLLGEQAKGLANGGEADLTNYYDRCGAYRERRLTTFLNWLDSIAAPGTRTKWDYKPLFELSAAQKSKQEKEIAETDKLYFDIKVPGIVGAIRKRLTDTGQYTFTDDTVPPTNEPVNEPQVD